MIKANEAIVGHWFHIELKGMGLTEIQLTESIVGKIFGDDDQYALNDFNPIQITPEWLERAGFIYWKEVDEWGSPDKDCVLRLNYFIGNSDNGNVWYLGEGFYETEYHVYIKYLHQLQNLYHSLTATELVVK
jgi:hypothetical protein